MINHIQISPLSAELENVSLDNELLNNIINSNPPNIADTDLSTVTPSANNASDDNDENNEFTTNLIKVEKIIKKLSLNDLSDCRMAENALRETVKIRPLIIDAESCKEIERNEEKGIYYRRFSSEADLQPVIDLITKDLSEPYSIYTYRYFIYNWPRMCIMAFTFDGRCVGAIVGKTEAHASTERVRGYIAMLAVQKEFRRRFIGSRLVELVIDTMVSDGCTEVVLETEITNKSALSLYEKLGFIRDKRLFRYYLNGVDAFRLKLWMS